MKLMRIILYLALVLAVGAVVLSYIVKTQHDPSFAPVEIDSSFGMALLIAMGVYTLHALLLRFVGRLTTRSARWLSLTLYLILPLVFYLIVINLEFINGNHDFRIFIILLYPLGFILLFPGLIVFSMPSTFLSTLPLLLQYLILAGLFINEDSLSSFTIIMMVCLMLASYLFPRHRRLKEFWKPSRLPRIVPRSRGFTLIELLIVVAIISSLTVGMVNVTAGTRRLMAHQSDWRTAVAMAEEQLDLLRARGALPEPGRHPLDPELARRYPLAAHAAFEVGPGPGERLREVWVRVRLKDEGIDNTVTLAAILPAGAGEVER